MTLLSPHFSYEEMTFSDTAQRQGIPNIPNQAQYENLKYLCSKMEKIREILGVPIRVTSAFRSGPTNKAVGGSEHSSHVDGLACDFQPQGMNNYDAAKRIYESGILFDQLILEYGWVHIGFGGLVRQQCLTKRSKDDPYLAGLVK